VPLVHPCRCRFLSPVRLATIDPLFQPPSPAVDNPPHHFSSSMRMFCSIAVLWGCFRSQRHRTLTTGATTH
jgi:hypothetical protein